MPQTDRPLGEMSDEELRAERKRRNQAVCEVEWEQARRAEQARAQPKHFRAELSRRERRSATRETGAQDDA